MLFGRVREDCGKRDQEHDDSRGRGVFVAEPVHQDERHLSPVLVTVRGPVEMQDGSEYGTRPPFNACDRHRCRIRGTRPLALASASSRVSRAASDSATRRPNGAR